MYWLLLVSLQLVEETTASYFFIPAQVMLSPLWINDKLPIIKAKKVKEKFGGTKKKLYLCNRI